MKENLTTEQKILALLADQGLITDATLIAPALVDPDVAEQVIDKFGNLIPDDPIGDCDHEPLTNEEIQEVFDNDYYEKKEAN